MHSAKPASAKIAATASIASPRPSRMAAFRKARASASNSSSAAISRSTRVFSRDGPCRSVLPR
jgi:hypothetical protein